MDIPEVKMFNSELSGLYDNKPPISKAKMSAITKGAVKAIKFYKHVVHSVEKFILKCKPEYKIPGLYVIDSIVRQSRHQFGAEKDVFAPRFAKNMQQTFINLLRCPPEDKRNIIRVLNLWQKNYVFCPEVIQPLFDLANPNHPTHQEFLAQQTQVHSNGSVNADAKNSPALASQHTPTEPSHQDQGKSEAALLAQLRHMQHLLRDGSSAPAQDKGAVNFNRRLLNMDFEYESEDDGGQMTHMSGGDSPAQNSTPALQPSQPSQPSQQSMGHNFFHNSLQSVNPNDALGSILANPEILRHLQSLQAQMMVQANFPQMQPEESNKPPSPLMDEMNNESDIEFVDDAGPQVIEIDGNDSRSPSPKSSRRRRSRERSRRSRSRSRRGSRSRSRDRRGRRASREREREKPRDREREREREKERERDREKERERKKKGLPFIRKDTVSVCSTTLWVGHLSKLVQAEELSDSFGAIGDVVSIDLVPPRGCAFIVMNRRRDAARAINKLNKQKMHGKAITVAWAPGKGVKGREWKDYWEAEAGACYVPWARLPEGPAAAAALEALEEGGMLDEETLPIWLQRKPLEEAKPKLQPELSAIPPAVLAATANPTGMMVVSPLQPPPSLGVEPGCLPPALGPLSFAAHPALPLPLPLLGFKPTPQAAGLQQALHLQAVLAHHQQQQHMAAQLLLAPPPRLGPPIMQPPLSLVDIRQDDPMEIDNTEDMPPQIESHSKAGTPLSREDIQMTEKYKNMISLPPPSFNVPPPSMLGQPPPNTTSIPPPGNPMPPHNSSIPPPNTKIPPPLTSQPPPALGPLLDQNIQDKDRDKRERESGRRDRDRRERDRDGGRRDSRHEREKDRERDRNGERNDRPERPERNDRERERGDRDRERDRGERDRGRDRGNRWGGRGEPGSANRDRPDGPPGPPGPPPGPAASRSLQDRLWEMANGPGQRPHRPESPPKHPRNHIKDGPPPDGLLGDVPPPGTMMPLSPPPGPPLLPPMAPFRIGREEMRMGGMGPGMGPRGPMRPGGPGMWMDGPNPPFGPRFPGGPPFNRPPFDGPPFDGPPFDGPPFDGPGPPFDGPGPHFERQRFDREFDRPFDRSFDRPHFDGPGRPPYDRPGFDGPYEDPHFERPMYDGPPDAFFERGGPRGPPGPPRGMRNEGRGDGRGDIRPDGRGDIRPDGRGDIRPDGRGDIRPDGRGDIRPDGRRPRGDRDTERSRNSRWAGRESLEPNPNDFEQTENDDMGPLNEREPEIVEKPPVDNKVQESTVQEIVVQNNREESVVDLPPPPVIIETAPTPPIIHEAPPEIQDSEPPQKEENESVAFFEEKENVADSYVSEMTQEAPEIVPVEVAVEPERNVTPVDVPVEREEPPAPVEVSAEADSAEASEEGRSTPCRDEPPPGEAP